MANYVSKVLLQIELSMKFNKKILGTLSDGDLRRALNQEIDIENSSVSSVMTKEFISISENDLAIDAAKLMENNKIFIS